MKVKLDTSRFYDVAKMMKLMDANRRALLPRGYTLQAVMTEMETRELSGQNEVHGFGRGQSEFAEVRPRRHR